MIKQILLSSGLAALAGFSLAACSAADTAEHKPTPAAYTGASTEPASDNEAGLDFSRLPEGFPVLGEMTFSGVPQGCRLFKAANGDVSFAGGAPSFVFTQEQVSTRGGEPLYQVAVNGEKRLLKMTYEKNYGEKNIRYLTTVDAPKVDILVEIEPTGSTDTGATRHKGIVGRIKAWDEGLPLLCGYNRVRVEGDCEI